jgi:hypothetical protein
LVGREEEGKIEERVAVLERRWYGFGVCLRRIYMLDSLYS